MYTTERLQLRTPKEVSIEQVMDYYRDNKQFLKPFEPARPETFYTYRSQSIDLYNDVFYFEHKSSLKLFLFEKDREQVIGILNFSQIIMGPFKSCYVGYSLLEDKTKMGYMTEALKEGIRLMFEVYGLHRIEGNVMPDNYSSIKILKNLGFEYEGRAKKYLCINGRWEDHDHYVLLNEDL